MHYHLKNKMNNKITKTQLSEGQKEKQKSVWLNDLDVANTGVDSMGMNEQMKLCEAGGVQMENAFNNTQEVHTITYNTAMKSPSTSQWRNTKCSSKFQ